MKQKPANELIGIKGHFFYFIVFFSVLVGKSYLAVVNADDAVVGYSNPVSVTTKILKHLIRTGKRTFCVGNALM